RVRAVLLHGPSAPSSASLCRHAARMNQSAMTVLFSTRSRGPVVQSGKFKDQTGVCSTRSSVLDFIPGGVLLIWMISSFPRNTSHLPSRPRHVSTPTPQLCLPIYRYLTNVPPIAHGTPRPALHVTRNTPTGAAGCL